MRKVYKIFLGNSQGRKQLEGRRSKLNIKTNIKEIACEVVDWVLLAQDGELYCAYMEMRTNFLNPSICDIYYVKTLNYEV
jgi:hypothetical protein